MTVCQLLASPLGKLQVIPLAPVPVKCTLHEVMIEMYRENYAFANRKKEKKTKKRREKRKSNCYFTRENVSHSIHTKCFQIVHKYQRHYERFFGDETKVQESQGNRANERKQSSSCLCFLKDNQTSWLSPALGVQPHTPPSGKFTSQLSLSGQNREPFLAR